MKQIVIKRDWFEQWLVGVTDGHGTFRLYNLKGKWSLVYEIEQSRYNLRMLHFIKKELGVGSITKDNNKAQFVIRDRKKLQEKIFPIFDKYPLLTSKQFNYLKLKEAFAILNNINLDKNEKDEKLLIIKNRLFPDNYSSFVWDNICLPIKKTDDIIHIVSKPWLIGFVEAEGSFYLVKKDEARIVHGFGIAHKLDKIVLQAIKSILHIPNTIKHKNSYMLDTTNSRAIENIIKYFFNTMKGMKSAEYKIWARSYNKNKGNYFKLVKVWEIINKMRKN